MAALVAVLAIGTAAYAQLNPEGVMGIMTGLFGPPKAELSEAYEKRSGGPTIDHSLFDVVVRTHVREGGWVDYAALHAAPADLDRYLDVLANAPVEELGRDERLALLINAYNAFTVRLILDHYPIDSIKSIPKGQRWDDVRWNLGGELVSLNQIEHERVRPKFAEPRIHFAMVCAAVGCPPLRMEAYSAERIEEQLEDQARYVHANDRWFRPEEGGARVGLTALYDWYGGDFEQIAGSVLDYVGRYVPEVAEALASGSDPKIRWIDYDWSLNEASPDSVR